MENSTKALIKLCFFTLLLLLLVSVVEFDYYEGCSSVGNSQYIIKGQFSSLFLPLFATIILFIGFATKDFTHEWLETPYYREEIKQYANKVQQLKKEIEGLKNEQNEK